MEYGALVKRAGVLRQVRAFFEARGFVEVETPIRIPAPAMELHILAPESDGQWLRTSPELHMKRLLAAGAERIFQMGSCFRAGERGARHNPEFTMLEWYRAHTGLEEILEDTEALTAEVLGLARPFVRLSVEEAYVSYAGWNPLEQWDADRFDVDMVNVIEPSLAKLGPCFLTRYPAQAAALAQLCKDDLRAAERAELYVPQTLPDGRVIALELANGYGELCDAVEQRKRFEEAAVKRRAYGQPVYPLDEAFLAALPSMPPCGGIALGVDRLVMLACGASCIDEVRPFCEGGV